MSVLESLTRLCLWSPLELLRRQDANTVIRPVQDWDNELTVPRVRDSNLGSWSPYTYPYMNIPAMDICTGLCPGLNETFYMNI